MLIIILAVIAGVLLLHWFISRSFLYPFGLITPIAWVVGVIVLMVRDHSLIDARGIAAGLGGTAFLFAMWASGVDAYKKSHGASE